MATHRVPQSATVNTPHDLATAMVSAVQRTNLARWLDPCVGDGAFVRALSQLGVPRTQIVALDLRRKLEGADQLARTSRGIDFIRWAENRREVFDHVVMNPPYASIGRLTGSPKRAAQSLRMPNGGTLFLNANYWCAFVLRAIQVLKPQGSMVVVLPAAWDYARYAQPIREAVGEAFGEVIEIRSSKPLFPHVLDGSVVIVAKDRGGEESLWRRTEVRDISGTIRALGVIATGRSPSSSATVRRLARAPQTRLLGDLIDIRIGAVTGDARYFLLTEGERLQHKLPRSALRPVVTRSRHLLAAHLTERSWRQLLASGERAWLFSPRAAAMKHAAVQRYLRLAKAGKCNLNGYKLKRRTPWYRVPLPTNVDGFLSGMSKNLPFLVIRDMRGLTATNTLYVVKFKQGFRTPNARIAVALVLLSSTARRELEKCARSYADGLSKFEPAELRGVRVPVPRIAPGGRAILKLATDHLLAGREPEARALADEWLAPRTNAGSTQRHVSALLVRRVRS
jgi:adenine-specific DNA-methyltransferase